MLESHKVQVDSQLDLSSLVVPFSGVKRIAHPWFSDRFQGYLGVECQHFQATYERKSNWYYRDVGRDLVAEEFKEISIDFSLCELDSEEKDTSQSDAVMWYVNHPEVERGVFFCEIGIYLRWNRFEKILNSNSFYSESTWSPFYVLLHLEEELRSANIKYRWEDLGVDTLSEPI